MPSMLKQHPELAAGAGPELRATRKSEQDAVSADCHCFDSALRLCAESQKYPQSNNKKEQGWKGTGLVLIVVVLNCPIRRWC